MPSLEKLFNENDNFLQKWDTDKNQIDLHLKQFK